MGSIIKWFLAGVIGLGMIVGGIVMLSDDTVKCGSQTMREGQSCKETSRGGSTKERDVDEQRSDNKSTGWLLTGFGSLLTLGGFGWGTQELRQRGKVKAALAGVSAQPQAGGFAQQPVQQQGPPSGGFPQQHVPQGQPYPQQGYPQQQGYPPPGYGPPPPGYGPPQQPQQYPQQYPQPGYGPQQPFGPGGR
ncbi:hypothetical protein EV193_103600 [Herbihabitans rhizosphaerae]|uniref:Uncharacterized protein n=1 Tax=Herbihabitans rhizosphaerae TaxID=1872711 RepID=A0A4Q7KW44_9PSEU|nr:hypothetical protein [Herbihabitans rhizosphaerae]RZS41278.1 hypothetical protein EV193_103600 [Herbihabitans rhizosphaerae]